MGLKTPNKSTKPEKRTYLEVEKIRISSSGLKVGMYVCELDRPWEGAPFPLQGLLIDNQDDIDAVQGYCDIVYIDNKKSRYIIDEKEAEPADAKATLLKIKAGKAKITKKARRAKKEPKITRLVKKELKTAAKTYHKTNRLVKDIMSQIRLGKSIDTPAAKEAVAACVDNVIHRSDSMMLLARLRHKDEYTSEHSLNVAIISIALGLHMGMDRPELNKLGLCGLLHDMGKMLTPSEVLNKPGRLDEKEREIMKRHPVDGREILIASSDPQNSVIDVAYGHHEQLNGSGYPRGVEGDQLSLYTRMVTIADVFDAITGNRVYRQGETNEVALRILHAGRGSAFDPALVVEFTESIGIYPLGSVVEMHNGEIGIVIQTNPEHRLRPIVKLMLDYLKQPQQSYIVDLAKPDLDSLGRPYRIKASHNPRNFDIDLGLIDLLAGQRQVSRPHD